MCGKLRQEGRQEPDSTRKRIWILPKVNGNLLKGFEWVNNMIRLDFFFHINGDILVNISSKKLINILQRNFQSAVCNHYVTV